MKLCAEITLLFGNLKVFRANQEDHEGNPRLSQYVNIARDMTSGYQEMTFVSDLRKVS